VWRVADVLKLGDQVTGTSVLSTMYDRYAAHGGRIDIEGLMGSLGVAPANDGGPHREGQGNGHATVTKTATETVTETVTETEMPSDESGPLAWIRRGIVEARANPVFAQTLRQ
jgi:hypothetical protein